MDPKIIEVATKIDAILKESGMYLDIGHTINVKRLPNSKPTPVPKVSKKKKK